MANIKEQAVIDFLLNCPAIQSNPLYFNFINAKDDNKQIITDTNDKVTNRSFLDGSVEKQYTFTLIDFKSIVYNAIPKEAGLIDENVEDYLDVQGIIDWVTEQADLRNYPNFGLDCIIQEMEALTENPNLNGIDTTTSPSLAKYSVAIRITYIDTSKVLWNK